MDLDRAEGEDGLVQEVDISSALVISNRFMKGNSLVQDIY